MIRDNRLDDDLALDKPNEYVCCGCEVMVIPNYIEDHPNANICEDCPYLVNRNGDRK